MASFVALNIEPEDDSEDEIDDSKEIQIEEALKRYQFALKLHSQGPDFYDEAQLAYKNLFASEIFTYPEFLSESRRLGLFDEGENDDDNIEESSITVAVDALAGGDGAPSTLQQVLYLSYKNHGQFLLDRLKSHVSQAYLESTPADIEGSAEFGKISTTASSSLQSFLEALDRDDTDLELWRLVSRISEFLGSRRTARFCLETVLDTDRSPLDGGIEPPSINQIFAHQQLQILLQQLSDCFSKPPITALSVSRTALIKPLKKHLDLCPYLPPSRQSHSDRATEQGFKIRGPERQGIQVPLRTWASCGKSILNQIAQEAQGVIDLPAGSTYSVILPPMTEDVRPKSKRKGKNSLSGNPVENSTQPPVIPTDNFNGLNHSPVEIATNVGPGAPASSIGNNQALPNQSVNQFRDPVVHDLDDVKEKSSPQTKLRSDEADSQLVEAANVDAQQVSPIEIRRPGVTVSLPARKRSSDSAGLQENVDTGRSRSKRIKARVTLNEPNLGKESSTEEKAQFYEDQLQVYTQADRLVFEVIGKVFQDHGIDCLGTLHSLQKALTGTSSRGQPGDLDLLENSADVVAQDLKNVLSVWDMEKTNMFLHGDGLDDPVIGTSGPRNSGLTVFLEHSKRGSQLTSQRPPFSGDQGLQEFADDTNQSPAYLDELSLRWVQALLSPSPSPKLSPKKDCSRLSSTYEAYFWPDTLKETVVQMLVKQDEFIYLTLSANVKALGLHSRHVISQKLPDERKENLVQTVQNIFELHLDIYGRITNPSSEVDMETRTLQLDRLGRWAALASDAISERPELEANDSVPDNLAIRFLWSSVLYTSFVDPASRDHIVYCFQDLKSVLEAAASSGIELQNNAMMPEISTEAAEREISRLTTMDFFLSVFSSEKGHPLTVIESLEPILEKSIHKNEQVIDHSNVSKESLDDASEGLGTVPNRHLDPDTSHLGFHLSQMQQMLQFINRASVSLKLFLWRKLGDAYESIHYPPQVISCSLRSIEMIVEYLRSTTFTTTTTQNRHLSLVRWLRTLDNLTRKALVLALNQPLIFECVDETHLHSSIKALAALQRILYAFIIWEDSIRVGKTRLPPQINNPANTAYNVVLSKIRDMLVRVWTLQYTLLKEAITQNVKLFDTPSEGLMEYLKLVHRAFGLRGYCKFSNKVFLRFMKAELIRLDHSRSSENEMAQLVFDLYGLKICPSLTVIEDHLCPSAPLDRETAIEILDQVIVQANRIDVKDLIKSELRSTIDKMHLAIKQPKLIPVTTFNRRLVSNFLKSPINPIDLYRSLQGIGNLCGTTVNNESSAIADKGWYFLQGNLALAKFRSVKRSSAGPTDDLDTASNFFRQDLELGLEKWETWFRLAQVFDARIEEDTTWNAEKLNNNREELRLLQRNAINCYTMAVTVAIQTADASFETAHKMSDLYTDFAMRIYASSREPFSMEAFSVRDFVKHFNGQTRGMYKGRPFRDLQLYPAWKFASTLLRRASVQKSQSWMNSYMLGKCLWKMYNGMKEVKGGASKVGYVEALDAFRRAIELLPERRDSRHPEKQLTLEPHYKLVSVVHKLVQSRQLQPEAGCNYLSATCYARKVSSVQDLEDWEGYLIHVLKALRSADKANWHHRMVVRAAHAIYDDSPNDIMAALGAKHELTQQIFTKTMHIQVWRPDNERPGRHFVYTGRYVRFFVRLLYQLNDRTSLEALAKRNRKKSGDFFDHTSVWEEVCMAYLKLLRRQGSIVENQEDLVFKPLQPDVFHTNTARLENWAHSFPSPSSALLDLLRETVELKKLNSNLMKAGPIEDLVGDIYAQLYQTVVPDLVARSNTEENRSRMRVDHLLMNHHSTNAHNDGSMATPPPILPLDGDSSILGLIPVTMIKPRTKGINRRDIQRKAEFLVAAKALPTTTVLVPGSRPTSGTTSILTAVAIPIVEPQLLTVHEESVQRRGREGSSIPGSLHDSADDESELSDVGDAAAADQRPGKVMFPGLVRGSGARERGGNGSAEEGSEGEGEGEGDGEGEGNGDGDEGEGDDGDGNEDDEG